MRQSGIGGCAAWFMAGTFVAAPGPADARAQRCWRVETHQSDIVVHVRPAGLLASRLHEHRFVPAEWEGHLCFDPQSPSAIDLELTFHADSLEDRQPELSREDIERVEQQVLGPEVLDAARYPVIRFTARGLTLDESSPGSLRGTLNGELSLHGQTRSVDVPLTARWTDDHLRTAGTVTFKQSDFGIEPYSRFLGTVRVADRISVEFAIDARPQVTGDGLQART